VRFSWLVGGIGLLIVGCSDAGVQSGSRLLSTATSDSLAGKELIPAEWMVYEDTAQSGDVITASLQLPAAKDIDGLVAGEAPRLILRCIDGKVNAFIEQTEAIAVQLDSAPACE
jgi:hypothetical protein